MALEDRYSHLKLLTEALIDLYYVILSLRAYVIEEPRVLLRGYKINLPLDLIRHAKILKDFGKFLEDLLLILQSPSRIVVEELKVSNTVEGRLDIPLTSRLLGSGLTLIATRRRRLAFESLENILVKAFLLKVKNDIDKMIEYLRNFTCNDIVYSVLFKSLTSGLDRELLCITNKINKVLNLTFLRFVKVEQYLLEDRALRRLALKVAERRVEPYYSMALRVLEYLRENTVWVLSRIVEERVRDVEKLGLKFWDYKLYEVYVYFTLLYTFLRELEFQRGWAGPLKVFADEAQYDVGFGDIVVTYDKAPVCKSWISHGRVCILNDGRIDIPSSRPDFTIQVRMLNGTEKIIAVGDAKYRVSSRELSQSRFKILGYMHEYNVPIGALFFDPSLIEFCEDDDKEVGDHIQFMRELSKTGGAIIMDKNRIFFIAPLKPMKINDLIESNTYPLLQIFVNSTLKNILAA